MCQSQFKRLKQQQGFSLLVVLVVLLVLSIIVIGATRYINTDLHISANDRDRKVAFSYAEATLEHAELRLLALENDLDIPNKTVKQVYEQGIFTVGCFNSAGNTAWQKGLCIPSTDQTNVNDYKAATIQMGTAGVAWKRKSPASVGVLDPCGNSMEYVVNKEGGTCSGTTVTKGDLTWANPHYIIEILDKDVDGTRNYRITARAWGKNRNTAVTLQSYVSAASAAKTE